MPRVMSAAEFKAKCLEALDQVAATGEIDIVAAQLVGFHGDPADRMIVATALSVSATLITADDAILKWQARLRTYDARA